MSASGHRKMAALSVIRLQSEDVTRVIDLADHILRHGGDIQMKLLSFC